LPPVQQGCEFDSLDTAGNPETKKQPVEMSFHSSPRHFELSGNLGVVTALQKQLDNLLFAWTEPNSLLLHSIPLMCHRPRAGCGARPSCSNFHSIQTANLRRMLSVTDEQQFPQALTCKRAALREFA